MDPVCHTLAGAALAQSGLKRATPLATAALIIGANIPDVDVVTYAWGSLTALEHRRGWTHGVLALAIWPLFLTAILLAWHRLRRSRESENSPVRAGRLLALSALAVVSHPLLDLLNTYGIRLLMPFSGQWFYGDVLFIIDLWLLLLLGSGVALSVLLARRIGHPVPGPARASLALGLVYVSFIALAGRWSRAEAEADYRALFGDGEVVLASPVPLDPLAREILVLDGAKYRIGSATGPGGDISWESTDFYGLNPADAPEPVTEAAASEMGRQFLSWARFPTAQLARDSAGMVVHLVDLRYATGPARFGSVSIAVSPPSNVEANGD